MLVLNHIVKDYVTGDTTVRALDDVSLAFRKNEFVSILGHSGCGKTTMLNIIGGLDKYTSGVMAIKGVTTEQYKDADWDTYRNHSIGFVFQSYNLIPHQTVLANVELALTLSGVSKVERRKRATEVLERVGLGDQLHKKPSQMSGGQMQRVAIARALVNDPEILLADEPTGALDTDTSVQIMEILKEISKDKLIIMVTHNPELAEKYSDRIIRLSDGRVVSDSNSFSLEDEQKEIDKIKEAEAKLEAENQVTEVDKNKKKKKKPSMSFWTALTLSFNNLLTKKTRTFLTSFAGSIGIIGIALILALSNGINAYIATVQEDTLSTYPLTLQSETQDMSAMLGAMTQVQNTEDYSKSDKIHVDDSMGTMMSAMSATVKNDLTSFKSYLDLNYDKIKDAVSDIKYTYDFDLQVFTSDGKTQVNPTTVFDNMGEAFSGITEMMNSSGMAGNMSIMSQMLDNKELLDQQYEVVAGEWADDADEIVLVVTRNNQISKMALYMLGVLDQSELEDIMKKLMSNGEYDTTPLEPYTYEYFLNMKFRLLNTADFYEKTGEVKVVDGKDFPLWRDVRKMPTYNQEQFVTSRGRELKITGIIRPREGVTATSISGSVGYTKALTDSILADNLTKEVINQQKATPTHNVLTGLKFERTVYDQNNIKELIDIIDETNIKYIYSYIKSNMPPVTNQETFLSVVALMSNEQVATLLGGIEGVPGMLALAQQNNPTDLAYLYAALGQMMGIQITTPENILKLIPSMTIEERMVLFMGIPAGDQMPIAIKGLHDLCGETAMSAIYAQINDQMDAIEIDRETVVTVLQSIQDPIEFAKIEAMLYGLAPQTDATLESNLKLLGDAESASPASINFYAKDFASKEIIEQFIKDYNASVEEVKQIKYTDVVGILMSSVTTIVDVISYVLIAFVSISLVVSSIMIGIITYISVLERTKEIGILRAIGASKRDISRVFNAETFIVGFVAGMIGILSTIILCLPISAIVRHLTGIPQLTAFVDLKSAIVLVLISMVLTLVAGLIPSGIAAKKDPVESLRSE